MPALRSSSRVGLALFALAAFISVDRVWGEPTHQASPQASGSSVERTHDHHYADDDASSEEMKQVTEHELSQLMTLDQRILELSRQERATQKKLEDLKRTSTRYQLEITELNMKLKVDRTALMRLLTLQERVKPARVVELLLSADGPLEQKRREVYLSALFKTGAKRLKALALARRDLNDRQRALAQLSAQTQQLTELLERQSADLTRERRLEWEAIATRHRADKTSRRGEDPISPREWTRPTRLPPAQGEWIDEFKSFRGIARARMYGGGVWIRNSVASPTYAVEKGEVIFADHLRGWGAVVMIRHQFSFISIYANLSRVLVKRGERVQMQTRIGNSGVEAGREGVYFELRRGGEPIHPERWINRDLSLLNPQSTVSEP